MQFDTEYIYERLNKELRDNTLSVDGFISIMEDKDLRAAHPVTEMDLLGAFSELRLKMAEHMKLDNVIFLVGNGVSMYAGSKDSRDSKLDMYKDKYEGLEDVVNEVAQLDGVEEQLNALITIRSYYHILKDEKENLVGALINDVKRNFIYSFVNSVDYENLYLHELLLRKLRAFGCINRTSIYTSNYDLSFEHAMDKLRIDYMNGFSGFVNRLFDPRVFQEKDKTALVKVHGSINWISDGQEVKEIQPEFSKGIVVIKDTEPVLIYPTSNKLYQTYSTPYSELMRQMLDEMRVGKNVIIVIGYKFGDEHINDILYKAFENPNNIFYFFLYEEPVPGGFMDKVKQLSEEGMQSINILTGKVLGDFENIVRYVIPAAPEKTDEEKAIEMLQKVLADHE